MLTVNGSDISPAVFGASVSETVNLGAAAMRFSVLKSEARKIENGAQTVLSHGGETLFAGRVFSRSVSRDIAEICALDSLRGLNAVLPVDRLDEPADGFIKKLLALAAPEVAAGDIESCPATLLSKRFEGATLLEVIYRAIGEASETAGRYVLRDEAGRVALRREGSLRCGFALDGGNVTELAYERSVGEAYNYVKLTSNSVENAVSAAAIVRDEASIAKWGLRSYVGEVYQKNPEQLVLSAKKILNDSCREREKLSVTAAGNARARAGCLVPVDIDGVGAFWTRILSSEHSFEGAGHIMRLELERV